MPRTHRKLRFPVLLLLALLCAGTAILSTADKSPPAEAPSDTAVMAEVTVDPVEVARIVAQALPQAHLSHEALQDAIAIKAFDEFITALDYDRTIFMAEDVEEMRTKITQLDDDLREGTTSFANDVFDLYKKRAADRVTYVDTLLETGFDINLAETYVWKRDEADWPASAEAWNDVWRKKVKHEYVAHLVQAKLKEERAAEKALEEPEEAVEGEDEKEVEPVESSKPPPTPEEMIRKKYKQYLEVISGHDEEWILQVYLSAFAQAYDAHSSYMSPRVHEDFDISMKLSLTGIGALLRYDEGAAKVVELIAGGPAEQDGRLKPGDKIIAVAQGDEEAVDVLYWPLYKTVRLIRGPVGARVVLSVIPAADEAAGVVEEIDIVRDVIKLEERAAKSEIEELPAKDPDASVKLGVIKLRDFYADLKGANAGDDEARSSSRDVRRLLEGLKEDHVDGVLLDLRSNGGGSLTHAVEMTGLFLARGPVVQVKAGHRVQSLRDPDPGIVYDGPLVVLVNRMSASASEILAGALQDYGRAVIIGDSKTHGKGSVQTVIPLRRNDPSLGSLKITTAGFYRVDGDSTQLHGVAPDIVLPSVTDVMEIGEDHMKNVLPWSQIEPTRFKEFGELGSVIAQLQKSSEERVRSDERYQAYSELIDRAREKRDVTEVSLQLEKRLDMARKDREINDLQKQFADVDEDIGGIEEEVDVEDEPGAEKEKKARNDVVLSEALNILRDLAEIQRSTKLSDTPADVSAQPDPS